MDNRKYTDISPSPSAIIKAMPSLKETENRDVKIYRTDLPKDISIIGLGYVGAVSSACFASMGHQVMGVDIDETRVKAINAGSSPILESHLDEMLQEVHGKGKLKAISSIARAVSNTDITLVSVCTPSKADGSCDTSFLEEATLSIGKALRKKKSYHVVVFRSTIPPSTTEQILIPLLEKYSGKRCDVDFGVCFNPEFLRESTAITDFFNPPKTVIGSTDPKNSEIVKSLYGNVEGECIFTSITTAEFTKYVDNTWHALKVSFGNEVGRLCKAMNVDSHEVMQIFCKDTQLNISSHYLMPGFAYGGSCLPKDTRGIAQLGKQLDVDLPIISHIDNSNRTHIDHAVKLIEACKKDFIAIVGLTFKPDTDDLRESPALTLYSQLKAKGYEVICYDPYITQSHLNHLESQGFTGIKTDFTDKVKSVLDHSQVIISTHNVPYAQDIVDQAATGTHIIDLARLPRNTRFLDNYNGICW